MVQRQKVATLVLDTAPLLQLTSDLSRLASSLATVQGVLDEVRDARARQTLASLAHLSLDDAQAGLQVLTPDARALARVTAVARQTGDLSALSATDLAVLALAATLQAEHDRRHGGDASDGQDPPAPQADTSPAAEPEGEPAEAGVSPDGAAESSGDDDDDDDDDGDGESASDDGEGEWITPTNLERHRAADDGVQATEAGFGTQDPAVGCMTSDFAMQNVLLQMGIAVIAPSGLRIRHIKTWILRCHGCYRLCRDPLRRFCPHCGGATLTKVSITYCNPSPTHPKGYILHLKQNYTYRLRGTVYSIPNPLKANAKGAAHDELILREDQREYQRGLKTAEIARRKQERALAKAVAGTGPDARDWVPAFLTMDETSRRGQGGRVGKDGLPIIGYGRRNPNEVRRGARSKR